ncbi:lipoyl protein ligase domain-containing protein [Salinibaculum rarum]|uniref:lipoyl protein ligase domain-containing protein n=1 Tax=Salinibaculum rarum TaxID=3058903 RepID=UPI0026602188|nr:lipoate--protein ligase family protein [Salinibaculum sp. KK48]
MRVFRGRADTIADDRKRTAEIVGTAVETSTPALRVWSPHRQVAFGRRDVRVDGYDTAVRAAEQRNFPAIERDVGGRAVAYTGSTLAVVFADPAADRTAIQARYETATDRLAGALASVGVDTDEGEPPDSFCPGTHSLQATGKIAGLAQRVRRDVAITAGIVVVSDHATIASVLAPVYDALGVPFDPDSVDSVERAGGPGDPQRVGDAVVAAFADDP